MIEQVVKDYKTESFNSVEDVVEKLTYFRQLSDNGLHKLSEEELEKLRKEIDRFFNVHFTLFADTYPTKLFRITNNKYLCDGKKQKLQKISDLIGPPEGKAYYGRCNLPKESVFYAALDFRTAIWETKPEAGDYITLSEWKIKDGARLNTHMIFHPALSNVSKESQDAYRAYIEAKRQINSKMADVFEELMIFLTEQYMKIVDYEEHENYLFSGLYSSRLIQSEPDENGFKIDAVCYPSVKMEYGLTNLAIVNSLALEKLDLVSITVLDVGETNYDPENINVDDIIKVSPLQLKITEFDFDNDKIIYNAKEELRLAIELHEKYRENNNNK